MANRSTNTNRIFVPDEQSRAEAEAKELFKHNPVEDIKTKEANTRFFICVYVCLIAMKKRD